MAADRLPSLLASLALHVAVIVGGLLVFPQTARLVRPSSVPVTIVARAPTPDLRPAIQAPEPAPETTPEPTPTPTPEQPVAPPTPPTPAPPTPVKPPTPTLDLDALASKLPRRNAARGAARPETATEARPAIGAAQGLTADEASLLAAKLNRLWRPNCGAEGAADVQVRVNIQLLPDGRLAAPPRVVGPQSSDAIWAAAAQRALSAVRQGEPYSELPRARHAQWKDINFNFNARQACGGL